MRAATNSALHFTSSKSSHLACKLMSFDHITLHMQPSTTMATSITPHSLNPSLPTSNHMPATRGQCTNKILIIPPVHSRLQPRLFVERSLQCATEVLDNTRPEYLDRICSFLLANPAQPPVAGRHMRDLIIVDDLQRLDTFLVLCFPELVDLHRVDVQAARFVH